MSHLYLHTLQLQLSSPARLQLNAADTHTQTHYSNIALHSLRPALWLWRKNTNGKWNSSSCLQEVQKKSILVGLTSWDRTREENKVIMSDKTSFHCCRFASIQFFHIKHLTYISAQIIKRFVIRHLRYITDVALINSFYWLLIRLLQWKVFASIYL